ncbi:MAG: hypothetical protein WCK67_06385 [bacterium]
MSEKFEKILKIADVAHSSRIELWTPTFKAVGVLYKSDDKVVDGLVTLTNVKVYPLFSENGESTCLSVDRDWLNIFEDKVIAFTVI